jgi:hypothetical protein
VGGGAPFFISKQLLSKDDETSIPTIKMIFISREKLTKRGKDLQLGTRLLLILFLSFFVLLYIIKVNLL